MASPTQIAAYLTLFVAIGGVFLFVNLLLGKLVRPADPHPEKQEIYECGEPAIGTSFVQFDLRFYVVALVFIVFDAEVAFLFPAATVFGKQTQLADPAFAIVAPGENGQARLTEPARNLFRELSVTPGPAAAESPAAADAALRSDISKFTWYVYAATLIFFFVLFVGFAYEWKTGAFDWVRAVTKERRGPPAAAAPAVRLVSSEPVLPY
jgi:NADH-quinone oxidoreductase subunit A